MPLEMDDADDDDPPAKGGSRAGGRSGGRRYGSARGSWWRPAGTLGRILLGTCVVVVLGTVGTSAYLLKSFLNSDSRFRIGGASNIQATGLTEVSRAEMLPVFGEDIGRNIFFVPLGERRKQLEEIPWVESATVMRLLPDQIRVHVVERKPVAFVRHGQQIGLVDANGVLLAMPPALMAQRHYSFPVVTGIDANDQDAARKMRMGVYTRLLAELDANGQKFSEQISEIDLSDAEDARVLMPEQGTDILAHFGEDHFMERYQRYKAHINEWRQQFPKLAAVDLRYEQQAVLEMTKGTDAVADADQTSAEADAAPASKVIAPKRVVTPGGAPAKAAAAKGTTIKTALGKTGESKGVAGPAKSGKPGVKPAKASAVQPKAGYGKSAREKAAEKARDKKQAEAKRAALSSNGRKSHAVAAATQGQ
jgi:cell division protein FtsQ